MFLKVENKKKTSELTKGLIKLNNLYTHIYKTVKSLELYNSLNSLIRLKNKIYVKLDKNSMIK